MFKRISISVLTIVFGTVLLTVSCEANETHAYETVSADHHSEGSGSVDGLCTTDNSTDVMVTLSPPAKSSESTNLFVVTLISPFRQKIDASTLSSVNSPPLVSPYLVSLSTILIRI